VKIDRRSVVAGAPLGPLLVLVGYAVLRQSRTPINDVMLCALLVVPTVVLLVAAARRRSAPRCDPVGLDDNRHNGRDGVRGGDGGQRDQRSHG
jgi:hypothetical protein